MTEAPDYLAVGRLCNRWHDEVGPVHALRADLSPACGVPYYTASAYHWLTLKDVTCGQGGRLPQVRRALELP